MSSPPLIRATYRFGIFEADPQTGELRKNGVRLRIQDQPFQVLLRLLERPGQIVTREELKAALWSTDTFVDFDNGLNMAVKRLRESLGDDAERPVFIETVPRRGYRFLAPVDTNGAGTSKPKEEPGAQAQPRGSSKKWALAASCVLLLVVLLVAAWMQLRPRVGVPAVFDSAAITKDGRPKFNATVALVNDGSRLYFQEGSLDSTEQNTTLMQVAAQGGETAQVSIPLRNPIAYDFSQQRSELLLGTGDFNALDHERQLWALPLPAGPPHRLGDIAAHNASWAPDGNHLAFANGNGVFLAKPDGSEVRKIAQADGFDRSDWIRFSPDGARIRFTAARFATSESQTDIIELMEMTADGTGLHRVPVDGGCCGIWSPDGASYFYLKGDNAWVLPEHKSVFGQVQLGQPSQLTAGPIVYSAPAVSADGKHLFVIGQQKRVELACYAKDSKQWIPFLGGISATELEVSPDGQWVTYSTYPEFDLWRSRVDGSDRMQLSFPPIKAHEPRWSPDGKQILFTDFPYKLFAVSADGGAPRRIMPDDHPEVIGAGFWMPDGRSITFGSYVMCPAANTSCWAIYRMDLGSQKVSRIPASDGMLAARLSHDGRYLAAVKPNHNVIFLYDFQKQKWSELAKAFGSVAWAHDSKAIFVHLKHEKEPAELIRISVPDGRIQKIADLKGLTLGGLWPDWVSLLPDDSPVLMMDKSTEEIYHLDLKIR